MKKLSEGTEQYQFNNQLLEDLSFIKAKKRYPIKRMTTIPLISAGIMLLYLGWLFLHFGSSVYNGSYALTILLAIPVIVAFKRYIDMLRFSELQTPYFTAENRDLLLQFLQSEHFAFSLHPEAPEIFMMLSKNISAIGEEREVLIFIADDRRILINSHFTRSRKKFHFIGGATHHMQIIKQLRNWLKSRRPADTGLMKTTRI